MSEVGANRERGHPSEVGRASMQNRRAQRARQGCLKISRIGAAGYYDLCPCVETPLTRFLGVRNRLRRCLRAGLRMAISDRFETYLRGVLGCSSDYS